MKCDNPEISKLTEDYILEKLNESDTDRFEDHLVTCPYCQSIVSGEMKLKALVTEFPDLFADTSVVESLWNSLKRLACEVIAGQPVLEIDLLFRDNCPIALADPDISLINLDTATADRLPESCIEINGLSLQIQLASEVSGQDSEVFLLNCSREVVLTSDSGSDSVGIALKRSVKSMVQDEYVNDLIQEIMTESYITKGDFIQSESSLPVVRFSLKDIAFSYLHDPDCFSILLIR